MPNKVIPRACWIASFCCLWGLFSFNINTAFAGAQREEELTDSFRAVLSGALYNEPPPEPSSLNNLKLKQESIGWIGDVLPRFASHLNGRFGKNTYAELSSVEFQRVFLQTVWYESKRSGLDPNLVLALIQVESGFNKFAISSAGAVGYMQVMPFWISKVESKIAKNVPQNTSQATLLDLIGPSAKLLHLQTNIRFGCVILRHYLDLENEELVKALGRYNGNTQDTTYAQSVLLKRVYWSSKH